MAAARDLLPELARYYDIDVIADPSSAERFESNSASYDRVLYHVGNSIQYEHALKSVERHPGVAVLQDFFLGHGLEGMQSRDPAGRAWNTALYRSHGYAAVCEATNAKTREDAIWRYPANGCVIEAARGVIVHSAFAKQLARDWYGEHAADDWVRVPRPRALAPAPDAAMRARARAALGLNESDFVVCSFGATGWTQLSHLLLDAWARSEFAKRPEAVLVFVGGPDDEVDGGAFCGALAAQARIAGRAQITGWVDDDTYRNWLAAADVAVQLRGRSRGEASGALLDCMAAGLPTIVNAHGAMQEIPADAVLAISDPFEMRELIDALENLRTDVQSRRRLGDNARSYVSQEHDPAACARAYAAAIERFYESPARKPVSRQLLVDVSAIARTDLKTGIQRLVRSSLRALIDSPLPGYRIEPIYLSSNGVTSDARYARSYTLRLMSSDPDGLEDAPVEPHAGDVFLGLDFTGGFVVSANREGLFGEWKAKGVAFAFVLYDILPVLMPRMFPELDVEFFREWLGVAAHADAVFAISAASANDFRIWRDGALPRERAPYVGHFHLGADIRDSAPTQGHPDGHEAMMREIAARPTFLMVGTVEPRKGHADVVDAAQALWDRGVECNLVIVGKQGWMIGDLPQRIRSHAEFGRKLFWMQGLSDEALEEIYRHSTCLVAASWGEGFGLPLVEAAQHRIPIIARDLPVFREVAGSHAFYFDSSQSLADVLQKWLELYREGRHPRSAGLRWNTWRESTEELKKQLARSGVLAGGKLI